MDAGDGKDLAGCSFGTVLWAGPGLLSKSSVSLLAREGRFLGALKLGRPRVRYTSTAERLSPLRRETGGMILLMRNPLGRWGPRIGVCRSRVARRRCLPSVARAPVSDSLTFTWGS